MLQALENWNLFTHNYESNSTDKLIEIDEKRNIYTYTWYIYIYLNL